MPVGKPVVGDASGRLLPDEEQRAIALLCALLPPTQETFRQARDHSLECFRLLDAWTNYQCTVVLERGAPDWLALNSERRLEDFPLARLLTNPFQGQSQSFLPVLKAMLCVGVLEGRPEAALMKELASGALNARQRSDWRRLMPPMIAADASLVEVFDHCIQHVERQRTSPTPRSKAEVAWLDALHRWCQLLRAGGTVLHRVRVPVRPTQSLVQHEVDGPDEESPPPAAVIRLGDDDPPPSLPVSEGGEPPDPPASKLPEAQFAVRGAKPAKEGDPETVEAGEARRARTGFRSALENQYLPWTNRQLNPDDQVTLVAALKRDLTHAEPKVQDMVGLLAFAHVTGQLVEQAAEVGRTPSADRSFLSGRVFMRHVAPQEGAWLPDQGQDFLRPHATHVPLQLPQELAGWLDRQLPAETSAALCDVLGSTPVDARSRVREWLTDLREATGGLQTLSRVEWWLAHSVYQPSDSKGRRADHVRPQLVCAVMDGQPCPSLYYRSYEVHVVSALHRQVLSDAGWTMPEALGAEAGARRWVGSRLNLDLQHVKARWARVTHHFESKAQDVGEPLHVRHNARELHECFSLVFQTLHRVVSDPIESLEFVDLQTRRLLIDDKSQGDARAHRAVPLTCLAVTQCEDQIEHVRRLCVAVSSTAPATAHALWTMLERPEWRTAPFRFLLNEQLEIVRITPATLISELEALWGLPLNLARHFCSTWLLEQGASDEALSSLLGHHDLGTQNLSLLSPRDFDDLYRTLVPLLDNLVSALDMRSIPTFLPAVEPGALVPRPRGRPPAMSFGHKRREQARERRFALLGEAVGKWIDEQLNTRGRDELTQEDVAALFERVRKETANRRSYWATARFEALRAAIVEILRQHEHLKLDLPAVALAIKDVAHVCPMDGLESARWLQELRGALKAYWEGERAAWHSAGTAPYSATAEAIALTLVVDSLVIDPEVWKCWLATERALRPFADEQGRAWIRLPLPNGNSRLYPVRREVAEHIATREGASWKELTEEGVVDFVAELSVSWDTGKRVKDFWQLLNRVQGGSAAQMPGLVLGFADGSHRSVSPEDRCLERRAGRPPTLASVEAWHLQKARSSDTGSMRASGAAVQSGKGQLSDFGEFRRRMSAVLTKLDREAYVKRDKPMRKSKHRADLATGAKADQDGTDPKPIRGAGPQKRFAEAIEAQWDELVDSPRLGATSGFAVEWVHRLATSKSSDGQPYAPKTIRNYWYSWALRVIEEFGPIDPRELSPAEVEELYLQIVEDADVQNRQHLYAPMRNFHRFLVVEKGVAEIEWSELRGATGHGLTHVDANLVFEAEYRRALDLLLNDQAVSARVRAMQATVLVLVYRFGLRIAECLGLRGSDVRLDKSRRRWSVSVRGNQYRSLKTVNARRTVVGLEELSEVEEGILSNWSSHVAAFAQSGDINPLFASTAAGVERIRLFPRRVIALRVAQALRIATGDPSIRIHHCRHTYATRTLHVGLGFMFEHTSGPRAASRHRGLAEQIRTTLTNETDPTRRLIWAIAAALGHASPLTGLETYAHFGHEWLDDWCRRKLWVVGAPSDLSAVIAWSTGATRKTMQRDAQRHAELTAEQRNQRAMTRWSRVAPLGAGPRVELGLSLPPLKLVEGSSTLVSVDRILDHARRFGRVDGLSDALFVSEQWIESVLQAAKEFAARHRTPRTPAQQWWIEGSDVQYPEHEGRQIDLALETLQKTDPATLREQCLAIERNLVPAARMIVVETVESLEQAWKLARNLVRAEEHIELLVPAKLARRLTPAERELRDQEARRRAEVMNRPYAPEKPRLSYEQGIDLETIDVLVEHAKQLNIRMAIHGRVAGARTGSHSWLNPSTRLGLRIKENATELVHSAKVFCRVLASAVVAQKALELAETGANNERC